MAARTEKIQHDPKTKRLIAASQLLNRLTMHANGEIEMTQSQIFAAKIVIAKSIPDLKAVEVTGKDGEAIKVENVSDADLARRIVFALETAARNK